MKKLEDTLLWEKFCKKASAKQSSLVSECTLKAAQRLILVRDSFPTYTLHNELHAINVIEIMGKLLGDRIEDLDVLESALLILCAYYHDIGMVFAPEERDSLLNEVEITEFLKKYPKANLQLKEYQLATNDKGIPEEVAEWYCRWIHPVRGGYYLTNVIEKILWDGFPINDSLAIVCKSHGYGIDEVQKCEELKTDFLGNADLLFCAIILRLADILDFDNSRSPDEVYKYLGLSKKRTKREQESDIEWRKHLCSQGFIFTKKDRKERYPIKYVAAPNEPAVEYDMREFLNTIENEFDKCNAALKYASDRWQNFKLPLSIKRDEISSQGYTFGEFRFTLEQDQILNLLMGENLYSDPFAFIRELAQNAIDTTRHRVVYEKCQGNSEYEPKPVKFSTWTDNDGYTWLRIDDYGMGMDEDIITNYFLKVGRSYYQSEQFKVDQIDWIKKKNIDFTPISRFGIGVLSCFIIGDAIELSTRRVTKEPCRNALRMSMRGLNSFFILNEEKKHCCSPMPDQSKSNKGYRDNNEYGTSIAVRFNPQRDNGDYDLKRILDKYILYSPVPVELDGELIGGDYKKIIENKWTEELTFPLSEEHQKQIENTLKLEFSEPLKIKIVPLDLSAYSPTQNLEGQGIIGYVEISKKDILEYFSDLSEIERSIILRMDEKYHVMLKVEYKNVPEYDKINKLYGFDYSAIERNPLKRRLIEKVSFTFIKYNNRLDYDHFCNVLIRIINEGEQDNKLNLILNVQDTDSIIKSAQKFKNEIMKSHELNRSEIELYCLILELLYDYGVAKNFHKYIEALSANDMELSSELWNEFNDRILMQDSSKNEDIIADLQMLNKEVIEYMKVRDELDSAKRELEIELHYISEILNNDFQQIKAHWLSHNGIYVPVKRNDEMFKIFNPIYGSFTYYCLSLKDNLRPDLSISRDELRGISWQIYSAINLTFSRAVSNLDISGKNINIFSNIFNCNEFTYGEILKDPCIQDGMAWAMEKIIETNKGTLSLIDIKDYLNKGEEVSLIEILEVCKTYNSDWFWAKPSFIDYCVAALIQKELYIKYNLEADFIVFYKLEPMKNEELIYYPPLFFIEYSENNVLRKENLPININHPFSQWLLKNTENLKNKYPGLFEKIKICLSVDIKWGDEHSDAIINNINKILDRLCVLNYEDRPNKTIYLTENDFIE